MPEHFSIEIEGDFDALAKYLLPAYFRRRVASFRKAFLALCEEVALEELNATLDNTSSLGFEPLSQEWAAQKAKLGLDPGFWHATGQLLSSLKVDHTNDGIFVGWDDTPSVVNGEPLAAVAAALEFGVADLGIPPRPVLRPTVQRIRERLMLAIPPLAEKHLSLSTAVD
ncbi:hypothetical protein KW797_01670 [Candidatus Parcubacteria bacterium]|nr:hypothetical protein [Candidatus Parcubacteria bacterium]